MSNLKEMINRLAVEKADDTAFVYPCESGEMRKTYYDFKEDIYAFGAWMYSKKIIDKHVAIVGENSYEWLVVFLAAICGGNTALAIDKSLPDEEIVNLSKIGEADMAFATDTYFEKVNKKVGKKAYNLKDLDEILTEGRKLMREGKSKAFEDYEIDVDKTAAILFTSGTSGISKGVQLTNRNMAFEIVHTSMLYEPKGGVLAVLPFHHALGLVVGILMVVNYGQPIYINKSLKYVKKNMEEFGPQTMFLVPMFVEFFHKQIWAEVKKKGKTQAFKGLMKSTDLLLKAGVDVRKKTYRFHPEGIRWTP